MDKNKRTELLARGPIPRALRSLTIPAAAAMLVNAIYSVVDTGFIGLLDSTEALGASGVVFPIFLIIAALGLTFGTGAASVISRRLGEGRSQEARKTASTAFYTSLALGILFSICANIFIVPLLKLFGATDSILKEAVIYGRIIVGGSLFQILNMCMNNILRAEGASAYSGKAIITGGILNIILDPVFMFLINWGIAGAAAATVTSQLVSTLYLLRFFWRKKGVLRIKIRDFTPSLKVFGSIMTIGLPTCIRQMLGVVSIAFLNNGAAPFGDAAVAALAIAMRVSSLVMMVFFGIAQGLQPLAGFNYGACQYERVLESLKKASAWAVEFALLLGIPFFIFARPIMGLFSEDPAVLAMGIKALRLTSLTLSLAGMQIAFTSLFQAMGKGGESLLLATARQGFFFIPAIFILPPLWGFTGLAAVQPVADALGFAFTMVLGFFEIRTLKGLCLSN